MPLLVGIDVGAAFTKAAILKDRALFAYHIAPSVGSYKIVAEKVLLQTAGKAGLGLEDLQSIVATGIGASRVPLARERVSEISSHGRGAHLFFPSVRTVIDIGGQSSRAMRVDETGHVVDFAINEKCAAGSGRFLQLIARILQIPLEDIGPLSLKSTSVVKFTTGCAVFSESEAISRIAEGARREDILAGVNQAIVAKVANVVRRVGLLGDCAVVGGGAKNPGLVKSLEETLGVHLLVPQEPQLTAAVGAALLGEADSTSSREGK